MAVGLEGTGASSLCAYAYCVASTGGEGCNGRSVVVTSLDAVGSAGIGRFADNAAGGGGVSCSCFACSFAPMLSRATWIVESIVPSTAPKPTQRKTSVRGSLPAC